MYVCTYILLINLFVHPPYWMEDIVHNKQQHIIYAVVYYPVRLIYAIY